MKKMLAFTLLLAVGLLSAADLEVPCVKGSESYKRIVLPAVQFEKGDQVLLNFTMYMKRPINRGWAPIVRLQLNGKNITEKDAKGNPRLLGPLATGFKVKEKDKEILRSWWYQKSRLYVFYTPTPGKVDSRVVAGMDCKYSLDVTDHMTSGKKIDFRAVNYLYRELAGYDAVLILSNIEFKVVPKKK